MERLMKRLHMHVSVTDLAESIGFYETLFGAPPSVIHGDYAKWMLEDPRVNFAISQRNLPPGVDHVGIQVESPAELAELSARLKAAGEVTLDQTDASCCYAKSDKSWVEDPSGVRWESFYSSGEITTYGGDSASAALAGKLAEAPAKSGACCGG
jgi:catechol 2,3-dioxygenase-like lactoylglutathione lyase family enzyme